jgi:Cof subfamily protein (haloacid dehalogenase superfamily)
MLRLLAIDIDGTLLDSRGEVPASHAAALAAAGARGVHVALVTGRSLHFTRHVADALPLPVTLVVNNGALVKTPDGATPISRPLDLETARAVIRGTRAHQTSIAVVVDRDGDDEGPHVLFEHMDWTHPHRRGYFERNEAFIGRVSPLADALTEDPIEVLFTGFVAPMRQVADEVRRLPVSDRVSVAVTEYEHRDFSLVDVNAAGCTKGDTLARWTAALGLTREEVMAVGDNLNDLDMLRFAGTAVVMGNAADALKRHGFHVTGDNDEGGLAAAIDRFVVNPGASREIR